MIDLTNAINCIKLMERPGKKNNYKIGRITEKVADLEFSVYHPGQIILFRDELTPSDSELCMGEYIGMKQKSTGKVIIEIPLSQEEIYARRMKHSFITTIGTMVGVQKKYVEEIRI